ncbi:MAG: DUF2058 family protein [Fulvimonas sp.]|nr:DUF2058 family protein [Fulvimonas sp.]
MADSLRDQLLKSGIVKQVREGQRVGPPRGGKPRAGQARPTPSARDAAEIDLAKAYALRAQAEAAERRRAEQEAAERARLKRERKAKVQALLADRALNKPDAEHARHFEYGGKIRRVYADAEQFAAINRGELGIVQHNGRYLIVERAVAEAVHAVEPALLALLVDPNEAAGEDGMPADIVW